MQAQRLEVERQERAAAPRLELPAVQPSVPEIEFESPILPRDHPPWMRDAVALSAHARRLLQQIRPAVIRVLGFWDHAVRAVNITGRRINIDAAGCYRIG